MRTYSNQERENDEWSLPDVEIFQLTASEVAERDEDLMHEYSRKHEFRLASMNSKVREKMIDAMIEENGVEGGWFYWFCFPGCLPDSEAMGPYKTAEEAKQAAQEMAND